MTSCKYAVINGHAVITFNYPPVNGLAHSLRISLRDSLERALADPDARTIILTGSERAFSAGADVQELGKPAGAKEPRLPTLISQIEASPKPIIAAIGGICMGGGLELALGCHFRVASQDASIALPEVKLGLIPGAGGTQRLPRLVGLEIALNLIVTGEPMTARSLATTGLFDVTAQGDLMDEVLTFAQKIVNEQWPLRRARDLKVSDKQPDAFLQFARTNVKDWSKDFPAPLCCVEAIAASWHKNFDEGLQVERRLFNELLNGAESRALRHSFAAERAAAKVAGLPAGISARIVARVGIVGAGTMGSGIAMAFLDAGLPIVILEMNQPALDRGLNTIRKNYENAVRKGKLSAQQLEERLNRITPTLDYADLGDVDLVVEAAFEEMAVKCAVFEQLDRVCKTGAILASNTSYLDIDQIAEFTRRASDVLGLHFFSPANVMRLMEIVRGKKTAPEVLLTCMALARRLRKVAVVAGVCDGFIGNRMLTRYMTAATELLNAGASPHQIDCALQRFGMAMGPYRMGDLAGLDIGWATRKRRAAESGKLLMPSIANMLCEAGRFGQKTGAGWYRYEQGTREPLHDPVTDSLICIFRAEQGFVQRHISDEEIVERCIYALVNEGARILQEGIAARASDIDVVFLNGYGFPKLRGGPMFYAQSKGLDNVVSSLRTLAAVPGADPSWQPAPLLEALANEGSTFF